MNQRKAGWYWVELHSGEWMRTVDPDDDKCWVIAPWSPFFTCVNDDAFAEIGPRIPTPDERDGLACVAITKARGEAQ